MGSNTFYAEERPVHPVTVDAFWMDEHPVTVGAFGDFVAQTGYVTVAERVPDPQQYPGINPSLLFSGSLVFRKPSYRVDLRYASQWWSYTAGACWHRPDGRYNDAEARADHPVTHLAYEDAMAYATWAGKTLPTEADWERAARGGLDGASFVWGG